MLTVSHYSIPEEVEQGSVVANLAADLGLDLKTLRRHKMLLNFATNRKYLDVNKDTCEIYIVEKIDREYLCTSKWVRMCVLQPDATIENPV